jgi:hypothetical protein
MHNPMFSKMIAEARIADLTRASRAGQRVERAAPKVPSVSHVTLRFAFPDDERALQTLVALDSSAPPAAPVLVAEVDGMMRAALSLSDGGVIADPFYPTEHLVKLLRTRAAHLTGAPIRRRSRLARLRARLA